MAQRLIEWLQTVPHRFVPLFETNENGIVQTTFSKDKSRQLVKRHPVMEKAICLEVQEGLENPEWLGSLYVVGKGSGLHFVPIQFSYSSRHGKKHEINTNILPQNMEDRSFFARWGDNLDYQIGELSYALFGGTSSKTRPKPSYVQLAETLFASREPLTLDGEINLYIIPWYTSTRLPNGETANELSKIKRALCR